MPTMLSELFDKYGRDKLPLEKLGLDRFRKEELEETLIGSTPLLAVVGAGDFAVEQLRAARAELAARSTSFDAATLREQAQATLMDGLDALQSEMMAAPEQLMALPERAQEWPMRAQSMFADIVSAAFSTYGELAGRGKAVVTARMLAADDDVELGDDAPPVTRPTTGNPAVKPVVRLEPEVEVEVEVEAESPVSEAGFAPATPPTPLSTPKPKRKTAAAKKTASGKPGPGKPGPGKPGPGKPGSGTTGAPDASTPPVG